MKDNPCVVDGIKVSGLSDYNLGECVCIISLQSETL